MSARLRRRSRADDGFTLLELVVTVALLGIILVPLTGVVFVFLRNTVDTQARLTESHDVQFAAAYWQRDIASIGVRSSTYDTASHSYLLEQSVGLAPCGLPAGASVVVTLAWSEYTSNASPTTIKVTYATQRTGGVYELLRVRCGTRPSTIRIANSLAAEPKVTCHRANGEQLETCDGAGADVPALMKLSLRVHDISGHNTSAYTATLMGNRRQT